MKAIKTLAGIFFIFALLSWGVYFGIELLPVPFMRVTIICKSKEALNDIKAKFRDSVISVERASKYVYKDLPYYIVAWKSSDKKALSNIRDAISKYLQRRRLPYKLIIKKFGDQWLLKVRGDYKSKEAALKVRDEIYNKGDGYYFEVFRKQSVKEVKVYKIIVEIPMDKLKDLLDFMDALKKKYPNDKFIEIESSKKFYKQEEKAHS